jgi:RHS repeat-associated protein
MSRTTDGLTNTNKAAWLRRALCLILAMVVGLLGPLSAHAQTVVYFHNDPAGSPIAATDASGNVLWRESYRPYGERMLKPAAANTQWFHGKSLDPDTGMEDFGARNYDPVLGRFLSIDPVDYTEKNIHSFNRYAYGNNNPLKYKDPDGRFPVVLIALAALKVADVAMTAYDTYKSYQEGGVREAGKTLAIAAAMSAIPGSRAAGKAVHVAEEVAVAAKGVRALAEPIYKTTKEAKVAAEALDFKKINETVHDGQAVFKRGRDFITRDLDGHNGGAWKMADSVENLGRKETRAGTFDINLNRIGD